jgi:hypothetical protein
VRAGDNGGLLDGGALHPVADQHVGMLGVFGVFGYVPGRQLAHEVCVGVDHDPPFVDVADGAAGPVVDVEIALVSRAPAAASLAGCSV